MKNKALKLLLAFALCALFIVPAPAEENTLAGRVYSGYFNGERIEIHFLNDKHATFDGLIESRGLDYKYNAESGIVKAWVTSRPEAKELEAKIDGDTLVLISCWAIGEQVVLERMSGNASDPAPATTAKSSRELTPPKEKHTATYDILMKYGFHTAEGTVDPEYIRISTNHLLQNNTWVTVGVFVNDDGTKCFLDRKEIRREPQGYISDLESPEHCDITNCIKEVLYAMEGNSLVYAFVLIECKESEDRNIILSNFYGKNRLGKLVHTCYLDETEKNFSLEEIATDMMQIIKNSNDFYYSDNLKWRIESY